MLPLKWSSVLILVCFSPLASAHQFPEPDPPRYQSFTFPPEVRPAIVPAQCQIPHPLQPCARDAQLEITLEREYWAYVQRSDVSAMRNWIHKTLRYALLSQSSYKDRLLMLASFGEVMIFRSYSLQEPSGLVHASKALAFIERSHAIADQVPSSISMQNYLKAFINYTLNRTETGDRYLEELINLPEIFADYGSEGVLVGAFGLMALRDKKKVQQGLDILDDCKNPHCSRTTSISPYKMVGNAIAMAEAEAYLGREEKARQLIRDTLVWARERYYPQVLLEKLSKVEDELFGPITGLAKKWQNENGLGAIRLPLGPSQSMYSCAACHAGNEVPENYYSWRQTSAP